MRRPRTRPQRALLARPRRTLGRSRPYRKGALTARQGQRNAGLAHSLLGNYMKNRILIAGVAVVAAVGLAGGGAYVYFFSGLRSTPATLGLSATPNASPTATTSTGLAGSWTVTTGSLAGYRVKELFVGQSSKHEAVARTSTVSGTVAVSGDATSGYQVSAITIMAVLTDLHSIDSVAGRDVTQRDGVVSRQMDLQQFPNATFIASSLSVPGPVTSQTIELSIPGKLTIHGVTKDVTATAKAQEAGGKLEIAGSVAIDMTDYGVSPPAVPFVTVDSQVTVEFDIFLTKGSYPNIWRATNSTLAGRSASRLWSQALHALT